MGDSAIAASRVAALSPWLEVAVDAARSAAEPLCEDYDRQRRVLSDQPRDVKLSGDLEAERLIVAVLRKASPFPILTEESGALDGDGGDQAWRWIIDPVDGSMNYARGIPFACVSVALWAGEDPGVGVVFDFGRNELFTGIVGEGAWLNGAAIHASSVNDRTGAVLCTGLPAGTDFSPAALAITIEHLRTYKKIRMMGSAALSLAYVAAGRADAYFERNINLWDVAAGAAIVRGAGGDVSMASAADGRTFVVYAGAPDLPGIAVR